VRLFAWVISMSQGKIEPLIDAAEKRAIAKSQAELRELITALDEQLDEAERQIEQKIEQIQQRLSKLEGG
jgi:DNA repair exonuclease SbcCD ATPase subunit